MNKERWLFSSGTGVMVLDSHCDLIFGFCSMYQVCDAWGGCLY